LPPDFVDRSKSVEQGLTNHDRSGSRRQPYAVAQWGRNDVLLVEPLRTAACFQPHLRQQGPLALVKFRFRRPTIGSRLTDTGIGLDRLFDRVHDRKRFRLRSGRLPQAAGDHSSGDRAPKQYQPHVPRIRNLPLDSFVET
jgi:hypothetical protein